MFHHESGKTAEEPSDHIELLAHEVIDAGADVFVGHGEVAQEIIERFQRLSEPLGTKIDIQDGIGNIKLG